jgi:hypothetical protein
MVVVSEHGDQRGHPRCSARELGVPPLGRSLVASLAIGFLGPPDFHAPNENAPPENCCSAAWSPRRGPLHANRAGRHHHDRPLAVKKKWPPVHWPAFFCGCVSHSPSAILCLPVLVSRSSPGNSSMYPSWISRSLCSGGIVRCIGPLAQLRSDTNSSWVSGGADEPCAIRQICARNRPFSS